MNTARASQLWCFKDANLGEMSCLPTRFKTPDAYYCAVLAREFVKPGQVDLALVVGTTLNVGVVESVKAVVTSVVYMKDVGGELQE